MMKTPAGHWNPYVAGALVGVVGILSVALVGNYLGASTTFVRAAGAAISLVAPGWVAGNEEFQRRGIVFDWQGAFVLGVFIGALIASLSGKTFKLESVPPMWAERFGGSFWKRAAVSFIGGFIALFGARLAGGCPSGHGLSGLMTLSVSGLLAMLGFFGAGLLVANLIYRRKLS